MVWGERDPNDQMQTDFINAARANDVDRLEYLMDIEELQNLLIAQSSSHSLTVPRYLACQ
ncbi:hypothetical protein BDV06DRAFT_184481 [Aspergillus oleicola]